LFERINKTSRFAHRDPGLKYPYLEDSLPVRSPRRFGGCVCSLCCLTETTFKKDENNNDTKEIVYRFNNLHTLPLKKEDYYTCSYPIPNIQLSLFCERRWKNFPSSHLFNSSVITVASQTFERVDDGEDYYESHQDIKDKQEWRRLFTRFQPYLSAVVYLLKVKTKNLPREYAPGNVLFPFTVNLYFNFNIALRRNVH